MSLDTIMNLTITVTSRAPSQAGFGTPMLVGYHTAWPDRVREYAQADDMLDDGFDTTDDLYKAAKIVKSQETSPQTFKIGRRATALSQTIEITPLVTTEGFVYKGKIGGKALNYTVGAGATLSSVCSGLATAITALSAGTTATSNGTKVTCVAADDGVVVSFSLEKGMNLTDATTDTSTGAELVAIDDEDDDWYGALIIDSSSQDTALQAAGWIEAVRKICTVQTADASVLDPDDATDTMTALLPYARTNAIYHRFIGGSEWAAVGWQSGRLTSTPGSDTWAFKEIKGVSVDKLKTGEEASILKKNGSHYTNTGGLPITFEGKSGAGEFMDTVRFIDWVFARMRERVLGTLANNDKVAYTDAGVDLMVSAIKSIIKQGQTNGGFADDPAPTVTAPKVKDVDPTLRANRILPDIKWKANLSGAIHRLNPVEGLVSV